tara:strand:- start:3374 stop:5287 length:1914 start_codon:yes stop_codon:yes gene_type:complete
MKIVYSHLIQFIDENPSINEISSKLFQLGHEHEIDNDIFHMEFTPNRGDCLSINGILRDLAVFYTIINKQDIYKAEIRNLSLDFENLSQDACPQISFLKVEIEELPTSYKGVLKNYFSDLKLNPTNFFTDISNYLSYETGQPTHCYDSDKLDGKISFQEVDCNNEFETLLGKKINLTGKNAAFLLNNEVINLAGVMGGKTTACSNMTKSIIVECAFFNPEAIIGKSLKYDIQSEAAHKFERGVDPECHDRILRRFIKIISDHVAIKDISMTAFKYQDNIRPKILIDVNKINQIIGINISSDEYISYLCKLGFKVKDHFVQVPSFRSDIQTQNDLAEEVARVIGYDNIPTSAISIIKNTSQSINSIENKIRSFLLDHGFYEVINAPFVNKNTDGSIKVDNPLDSNREFLRTNIMNSLIDNLLFNERRQKDSIKLFEISDIYSSDNGLHKERKLGLIASGRLGLNYQEFSSKIDEKYLEGIFKETFSDEIFNFQTIPRDSLDTKIKSKILGLEVDISKFSENILEYKEISKAPKNFIQYMPISELPSSYKDISYLIRDHSKTQDLQDLIMGYDHELLSSTFIFDYFKNEKKNEIKIGFRFIFQSKTETLTSHQIENVLNNIVSQSLKINGIEIPGLKLE